MITEIEGIVSKGGNVYIVLDDDTEGTIELEMDPEVFDALRRSINREHSRSKK